MNQISECEWCGIEQKLACCEDCHQALISERNGLVTEMRVALGVLQGGGSKDAVIDLLENALDV